ncbi:hypothetical protein HGRIS_011616 [Hohenbuehelia grisea]|uniref:Uncharacterized protein n=1 Tax=Hohenbuehelia grisea TaxID=104357 RepID=A0ABR3JVU3_9AGAR
MKYTFVVVLPAFLALQAAAVPFFNSSASNTSSFVLSPSAGPNATAVPGNSSAIYTVNFTSSAAPSVITVSPSAGPDVPFFDCSSGNSSYVFSPSASPNATALPGNGTAVYFTSYVTASLDNGTVFPSASVVLTSEFATPTADNSSEILYPSGSCVPASEIAIPSAGNYSATEIVFPSASVIPASEIVSPSEGNFSAVFPSASEFPASGSVSASGAIAIPSASST